MPKCNFKTDAATFKKLPAAAALTNTITGEAFKAGGSVHTEISYKDPSALIELGQMLATISEDEIKAHDEREAKKAKTKKSK